MGQCKICQNSEGLSFYEVKERQLNRGETFQYMLCPKCNTLQLNQPVDIGGGYYDSDYYSFHAKSKRMLIPRFVVKPIMTFALKGNSKKYPRLMGGRNLSFSLYGTRAKFSDRVLDVGGGNGLWASFLKKNGFEDVTCIDMFCDKSPYSNIRFKQCGITDLSDKERFGLITFSSSFEHMDNPHEVLSKVKNILCTDGLCLIKMPVFPSQAWELYKENWFQIDAPRHYFLYSVKAVKWLCKQYGLQVEKVLYYSGAKQFYTSMYYRDSILSLKEINARFNTLSIKEKHRYSEMAKRVDEAGTGDTAWFYIRHAAK